MSRKHDIKMREVYYVLSSVSRGHREYTHSTTERYTDVKRVSTGIQTSLIWSEIGVRRPIKDTSVRWTRVETLNTTVLVCLISCSRLLQKVIYFVSSKYL